MKQCPICDLELSEPIPPFCSQCGWDLKNDLTLVPSLSLPEPVIEEYTQRYRAAKRVWNERLEILRRQEEWEKRFRELEAKVKDSAVIRQDELEKRFAKLESDQADWANSLKSIDELEKRVAKLESDQADLIKRLVMDQIPQEKPEPQQYSSARANLRSTPEKLSDKDVQAMLEKYNFFSKKYDRISWHNESGNFKNDFADNGDGTVTDRATGLMWQKGGSDNAMTHKEAQTYARNLKLAGYSDWRLPTLEELSSLLENKKVNDRYIDPVFDRKQSWCWSADNRPSGGAWGVDFDFGGVDWYNLHTHLYVRAVRPRQ